MKLLSNLQHYIGYYDEVQLFNKLRVIGKKIGSQVIYYVLIMYMLISDSKIPIKIRLVFMAALGYLILPTDLVADLIPAIGFTDDIAFLTYAISNAQEYITPEVRNRAKEKLGQWISDDAEDADIVDV
ncbi:MAG TPA: DUF1232 domain-containing protein [Bacteroidales bacterium]|jgi:uncharacterized membrane protein YkvA (DUF1232 family)|nr:hypothetical protein [Bacteroidota bacterium]HJN06776.1 DUF1232 domain-containing protein [Bacteroidales bacterium]|tara:strand:- start:2749 stop:3132 length:384 start_codon:yes stop_codon:yes gene_type:complete